MAIFARPLRALPSLEHTPALRVTRAFVAELCNGDDQARDDEPAHCIQPESDLPLAVKAAALTAAAHCAMRHSHSGPTQSQCEGPGAVRRTAPSQPAHLKRRTAQVEGGALPLRKKRGPGGALRKKRGAVRIKKRRTAHKKEAHCA